MSQAVTEHRAEAPQALNLAVLTVSDTRTVGDRHLGGLDRRAGRGGGAPGGRARQIVPDEPDRMRPLLRGFAARDDLHAILVTGGTGISPRDQTYETVSALLTKPLPGLRRAVPDAQLCRDRPGVPC